MTKLGTVGLLFTLCGCGAAAPAVGVGVAEEEPARVIVAAAVVELPPVEASPGDEDTLAVSPEDAEQLRGGGELLFRSERTRAAAAEAVGSAIDETEVRTSREERRVRVEVAGDSAQGALARCNALVRAHAEDYRSGARATALEWLRRERAERVAELAAIEESLALVPTDAWSPSEAADPDAVAAAADEIIAWLTDNRSVAELSESELSMVAAYARAAMTARGEMASLATEYGPRHTAMQAAGKRVEVIERQLAAQTESEARALSTLVTQLAGTRDGRDPAIIERARLRALLERLEQSDVGPSDVTSDMPVALRLIAHEHARLRVERELLALRYGDRHPEMVALTERIRAMLRDFETARASAVTRIGARLSAIETPARARRAPAAAAEDDERIARQRRGREQLVAVVAMLTAREVEAEQQPELTPQVLEPCHVLDGADAPAR
jgi:hypothetical protein